MNTLPTLHWTDIQTDTKPPSIYLITYVWPCPPCLWKTPPWESPNSASSLLGHLSHTWRTPPCILHSTACDSRPQTPIKTKVAHSRALPDILGCFHGRTQAEESCHPRQQLSPKVSYPSHISLLFVCPRLNSGNQVRRTLENPKFQGLLLSLPGVTLLLK